MARQSGKTMKVDVALPLDIYDTVVRLAEESDAPIHHRSNMRVLSPTILHLIGLGIKTLEDNPELLTLPITTGTDGKVAEVVASLGKLVDRISRLEDRLSDKTSNAVADISSDLLAGEAIRDLLSDYVKKSDMNEIFADRRHDLLKNTINHVTLNKALEVHPDKWQFEELQKAVEALGAKLAALGQVAQASTTPPGKLSLEDFVAKFPRKPLEVNPSWSLIKREDLNTKHGIDIQLGNADRVRYQLYLHDLLHYPDELLGRYFFKSSDRAFYDTQPEGVTNDQ